MKLTGFKAADHKKKVVPAGWHKVAIVSEKIRQAQSGKGEYTRFSMTVCEGEHQGAFLSDMLCLGYDDPNTKARALEKFGRICVAAGIPEDQDVNDTTDVFNRPMMVLVEHKDDPKYGTQAEVVKYLSIIKHKERIASEEAVEDSENLGDIF